jgi:hypothetical protein
VVLVARQFPSPFPTGIEDISGQIRCCEDKAPTLFSCSRTSGLFVFPMVKTSIKGKRFRDVEDIKKNETAKLNAVPLEAFADSF